MSQVRRAAVADAARLSRRCFIQQLITLSGTAALLAACTPAAPSAAPAAGAPAAATAPVAAAAPTTAAAPAGATAPAGQPRRGGTLTHGSAQEPDRFWTPFSGLVVSYEIANLTNAPLLMIDDQQNFIPALAAVVPSTDNGGISADGLTYTYKLRPGIKWSDGQPFTSADVKFTYDVLMMPGTDVRGRVGWDRVSQVDTPDDNTVIYHFASIDASFLERTALVHILPRHVLNGLDAQAINQHPWFRAPTAGLGPYLFKEWVSGDHLTLTRNPNYYKAGQPYIDTIVYKIIPDANTLVNQIETGEADTRVRMSNDQVDLVKGFQNAQVVSAPSTTPWLLWLNHTHAPFDDKAVRVALAYGFDKQGIAKQLLKGYVEPAWAPISPGSWAFNPNVLKHEYNPDKAKQTLDAAGWVTGPDGVRAKAGAKLSFEIMNIAGEQERLDILSFVQRQWKDIGVDARIKLVDVGTLFGQALPKRTFDMAYSFVGRYADPDISNLFLSPEYKPTGNFSGYANPELDKVLLDSINTADQTKRKEALIKAQDMVADDEVELFLFWLTNHTAINKRVQGYRPAPAYIEFWNADEWWLSN
jgi:peptide/nickel transport system substrate-binding protein